MLHSHLSDAERHWQWQRIADERVQVVVGARSAIFAPVPHLGLVILDEEHESTFKQETSPRYHARDVALARCEIQQVPLVLGSATPSLESWQRAASGRYRLVSLPRRVLGRPMPAVGTIDLRNDEHSRGSRGSISRHLHTAMHNALAEGGQVILLLNRRGFSTHIQCPACGTVVKCPHCDIALTHHRARDRAVPLLRLPGAGADRMSPVPASAASTTAAWARRGWRRRSAPAFPASACYGWTATPCRARAATRRP